LACSISTRESSFVPLAAATQTGEDVRVSYDKQQLWRHYGLDYDTTDRTGRGGRRQ